MLDFLNDVRTVLVIFGLVLIYRWVAEHVPNRTLAVLILVAAAYYFLFYTPSTFMLLVILAAIVFFGAPIGGTIQDLYFQYGCARELDIPREEMERQVMTPYGPRWKE
ncbi:MAG: hypothetical protein PWP76_529 [Candidatus Diapherotrites archaeon]|nr:hypothetical protein [Candidatus Diapherotrites archaeon]MDN5367165.1 hypothetical protein [Candidatus Diapherotrites archaeon]